MAKKRLQSYAWALKFEPYNRLRVPRLDGEAQAGLDYAQELALADKERSWAFLNHQPLPTRLTTTDIARSDNVSFKEVNKCIEAARLALFGNLSDRGIRHRAQRERELAADGTRRCEEPGCANPLPRRRTQRRHYCVEHSTSAARVRRHRSNARARTAAGLR